MSNVISFPMARRIDPEAKIPHPTEALSFMKKRRPRGGGIDYWAIDPPSNYSAQCEFGRRLAAEYLAFIGMHPIVGHRGLLSDIVGSMMDRARLGEEWSGVHLGFLEEVNRYAMAMAAAANGGLDG